MLALRTRVAPSLYPAVCDSAPSYELQAVSHSAPRGDLPPFPIAISSAVSCVCVGRHKHATGDILNLWAWLVGAE